MTKNNGLFVFIDAENMRKAIKECGYKNFDYLKLYNWLTEKKGAKRVYIYAGFIEDDKAERAKFKKLDKLTKCYLSLKEVQKYPPKKRQFQVKCENCQHINHRTRVIEGKSKANCDSELTLDVINQGTRQRYSEIMVFSGDGDFARMYEYVSGTLKKKVTVYSPVKGKPGKRTSLKIKKLNKDGAINLLALEMILPVYAKK